MINSKLVVAGIAALSLTAYGAGRANAQDEGGEEGDATATEGEGEAMPPPETTPPADDDGGTMASMSGCETLAGYPQAVIDRPRVLCKGALEISADLPISRISITILGTTSTSTGVGLDIGARYGLAPKIDAAIDYGFSLKEFEAKGDLGVAVQYSLAESDKMGVAAKVTTGFNLNGIDAATGDSKVQFDGLGLGVNLQYKITPKIAVFTPGDQITMGGADFPKPVAINLPFGLGFQANEKINAFLMTSIGSIGLSPSGNTLISDITPLTLGATFSPSNKMDIGASLGFFDLQHAGDFLVVDLHAALRM